MNAFIPKNDAETLMERFLWADYTEGRQGHGRIDSAEYTGYRALLETGGLRLVDIGRGEYDTYLSYQDIEKLFDRGVPRDRVVKVHPSQVGTEQNGYTLEALSREYEVRQAVDAEGNPLEGSSITRLQSLTRPLIDANFVLAESREESASVEDEFLRKGETERKENIHFQSEVEQILNLIDEEERNGILTHSQAEKNRERARRGEFILVDVGTGNFDTYLSLEEANELQEQALKSGNTDATVRLYDPSLLGDFGNPSGEVKLSELGDVFARRLAQGAAPTPLDQTPKSDATEEELQAHQERTTEQALAEEAEKNKLPEVHPLGSPVTMGNDVPASLLAKKGMDRLAPSAGTMGLKGVGHTMGEKKLEENEAGPSMLEKSVPSVRPEIQSIERTQTSKITGEMPAWERPREMPKKTTQTTEAKPKKREPSPFRGGPKRYEPTGRSTSRRGSSAKRWAGAMVGGTATVGGGIAGFTLLRRLGDVPELAMQGGAHLFHWIDPLSALFA